MYILYLQRPMLSYRIDSIAFIKVFFLPIPLYLLVYLFGIPETKNSVYFIHVYGIPTLITYQTNNLYIYTIYIHTQNPSEQPFCRFQLLRSAGCLFISWKHRWHVHVFTFKKDNTPKHVNNCWFSARPTHKVWYVSVFFLSVPTVSLHVHVLV